MKCSQNTKYQNSIKLLSRRGLALCKMLREFQKLLAVCGMKSWDDAQAESVRDQAKLLEWQYENDVFYFSKNTLDSCIQIAWVL